MRTDKINRMEARHFLAVRSHATVFILVIGGLWVLWLLSGSTFMYTWLLIPTLTWAAVLAGHCILVYLEFNRFKKKPATHRKLL
jgi:hypothetical protein